MTPACIRVSGQQTSVFDATNLQVSTELAHGWLVESGDDPAFAHPDFDDSQWQLFDASSDSLSKFFPNTRPDIVWYRLHLKVAQDQAALALLENNISSAFEIYSNGVKLLSVGRIVPFVPYDPSSFFILPIPKNQFASGSLVIALRVHISKSDWALPQPGYASQNLTVGQEKSLRERMWLQIIGANLLFGLDASAAVCVCIGALLLYATQQERREYLWLFLANLNVLPLIPLSIYSLMHTFPVRWWVFVFIARLALPYFWARMICAFVGYRVGWKMQIYLIVTCLAALWVEIEQRFGGLIYAQLLIAYAPFVLLAMVILPWILIKSARGTRRLEGLLIVPVMLFGFSSVAYWLDAAASQFTFLGGVNRIISSIAVMVAGPFTIDTGQLAELLSSVTLALIILIRSNRVSRQQTLLEEQIAAAREVQTVILPGQIENLSGFAIESVYEPAQRVGGDFFQILPASENGLLVVIGDVAGKGLPAAMLVSFLVGTIRTAAENSHTPGLLLSRLNEHLCGRTRGGFSTALAVHIDVDGQVSAANAGHLAPYLDGAEVELPGALPLGVVSGTKYETTRFHLPPGSRLTFYSDGVIEAENTKGELFGFDRARQISTQSALSIADSARQYGQQDDITVIAITRESVQGSTPV
ncbi:PP2C family protein-serine/threonine phosphatase [Occallatibacter savannae]|uniref:PP2C family protein-serine/threonine phosphatase n=1 Tax=Occallatibacter savannae TaxID=1002691 RepID=UPI0013A538E7|nr:PP2C family protein-serine/threonine phosphatase [Occallatibacter savannae]